MRIENKTGLIVNGEKKNGEKKMKMKGKWGNEVLCMKYKMNSYSYNYVDSYQKGVLWTSYINESANIQVFI